MRIFNGTSSQINLPLIGSDRLTVLPNEFSINFMPNEDVLAMIVSAYDEKEIALVVAGPAEVSLCSKTPTAAPLIVETEEEAIKRFGKTEEKKD